MSDLTDLLELFTSGNGAPHGLDGVDSRYCRLSDEHRAAFHAWIALQSTRDETRRTFLESKQSPFKDFDLRPLMRTADHYQARLCKIQTSNMAGTGFLIAPDVVLTNFHVVEPIVTDVSAAGTHVIFDYAATYDGSSASSTEYRLHGTDYMLAKSPYSDDEREGTFDDSHPAPDDRLDFAAIRLAGTPGKDEVVLSDGMKHERGWFDISKAVLPPDPKDGTIAFVFHHAAGATAKFSFHEFLPPNSNGTRIRYRTNTAPGSSGGLVVDQEFRLVGLHHAGPREYNQGIPLYRISQIVNDSQGQIRRTRSRRRCILVMPAIAAGTDTSRRLIARREQVLIPAINEAKVGEDSFQVELLPRENGAFDPSFSSLRTADLALVYLGPSADPFALAAVGFRAAFGRPIVLVSEEAQAGILASGLPQVAGLLAAAGVKHYKLPYNVLNPAAKRGITNVLETAFDAGPWGAMRVHPWTLIQFSRDSERYVDGTDAAARILLGDGHTAIDLVGRNGREVVEEVRQRVVPDQWDHFNDEQAELYRIILEADGRLDDSAVAKLRFASTPMVFVGGERHAFLPILTRYAFNETNAPEGRHQVEVAHIDVTAWVTMAHDGHWQVRPSAGVDGLQRLDRTEQLKAFLPVGIVSVAADGKIREINHAAELLLGWSKRDVERNLTLATQDLTFTPPEQRPARTWYRWDVANPQQLPPLGVHTFTHAGHTMSGCYLGVRNTITNESDGCVWVFAPVDDQGRETFLERLPLYGEREWLWQCYAGSYDKVLGKCGYYKEVRDTHIREACSFLRSEPNPDPTLLDVGAGTGNVCLPVLRELPNVNVVAIDASRAMLRVLQRKCEEAGQLEHCTILEVAAEQLDTVSCEPDAVTIMMALFDMDDYALALKNIDRKLRNGGKIVITEPKLNLNVEAIIEGAEQQLRKDQLLQHLQKDWNIVIASGRKLAEKVVHRENWRGVEGVLQWLTKHSYDCNTPVDCYFGQCQTIVARKR